MITYKKASEVVKIGLLTQYKIFSAATDECSVYLIFEPRTTKIQRIDFFPAKDIKIISTHMRGII